ncbi:IclR family transcriptional regulator [soil metagenome]
MNDVKSARRVIEILRFFSEERQPAALARIAEALTFPKSSCLALMDTLIAEGYAYQTAGRYYLTGRWSREADLVSRHDQLTARCHASLEQLGATIGETVITAKLSGRQVTYLDVIEADRVLRFSAHVGQHKPIHAAASGRALLGALKPDEARQIAATLDYVKLTATTPRSARALLLKVDEGVQRGWHVNLGDHQADTVSIAAAGLLDGTPIALVVGAPRSRVEPHIDRIGKALRTAMAGLQSANPS